MIITSTQSTDRRTGRRVTAALFAAGALMNATMATAGPVSTIAAADWIGTAWAGMPSAAGVVGTGLGAVILTRHATRQGWRASLALGYLAAALGGSIATVAVAGEEIVLLTAGMLLIGLGNAGALLARYPAAELFSARRRGFAIGLVVSSGAIGAVGGPLLLVPAAGIAGHIGMAALTGPFLLATLMSAVAAGALLVLPADPGGQAPTRIALRSLLQSAPTRSALAVMVIAQVVMAAIMTMAPLDMHLHHRALGLVGVALSAHTLGMFVLAPLTGWMIDRTGSRPVMLAGLVALAVATVLAAAANSPDPLRVGALFLLGYGWNLCFIGGSSSLASQLPQAERTRVEGAVDAAAWGAAATATLASTMVVSVGGYGLLAGLAASLAAIPAVMLVNRKQSLTKNLRKD